MTVRWYINAKKIMLRVVSGQFILEWLVMYQDSIKSIH
jgi:hypothetical protein